MPPATRMPARRGRSSLLLAGSLLATLLGACARDEAPTAALPAPAKATPAPPAKDDGSAQAPAGSTLTVYSGDYDALALQPPTPAPGMPGFALVETVLHYALQAGPNAISLERLPHALDVASVTLRSQDPGTTILGQRFLSPPGDARSVLAAAVGHRVAVEHTSGGARQVDNGTLVAVGDALTLSLPDGRTKVIREFDNVSLLDPDQQPAAGPQLRWQVQASDAGNTAFALAYATGGLAWRAEYLARLAKGSTCKLSLDGAAMVANRSGMAYRNVALSLVAGEPNRVQPEPPVVFQEAASRAMAAPPPPPEPRYAQPRRSGEYYAYPIPGRTTLDDGSLERVPLFAPLAGVACERGYETQPGESVWEPSQPITAPGFGGTGPQPVRATVSLANTQATGLGRPLPAGRVRMFEAGDFLGESQLGHTPEGADIDLEVGTAFDLTAERERRDFRLDRGGRQMTESFAVTLRNARKEAVTVTVVEPMGRWSDWTITNSSVPAEKRDAQHAAFDVQVPGGGEAVLTYTVRYRWPAGVRP